MVRRILLPALVVLVVAAVGAVIWLGACYNWCPYGSSLQLTRKTGTAAEGRYATEGQQGVIEQMHGPGRHFLNPWTYTVKEVRDVVIPAGQIATV